MPYAESELLPVSALQHLLYCERQCALIHVERLWAENRFTAEGQILHKKAHGGKATRRPEGRLLRALPVRSLELGLHGVTDVVRWDPGRAPVPVEYKRGKPKRGDCDRVQLCAQALCLEEMTGLVVPEGEIFYGETRRKVAVPISPELRSTTLAAVKRLRELVDRRETPAAVLGKHCDRCSLRSQCRPDLSRRGSARSRFERLFDALPTSLAPEDHDA